jgi:hypothetical protein
MDHARWGRFTRTVRAIEVNRPYLNAIPSYFITVPSGRTIFP